MMCVVHLDRPVKRAGLSKCSGCFESARMQRPEVRQAQRYRHISQTYGMDARTYQDMLDASGGLCYLCGKPETRVSRSGILMTLCIDHDHKTGRIRGLLCHKCNAGIGQLNDDPVLLQKAIQYLTREIT